MHWPAFSVKGWHTRGGIGKSAIDTNDEESVELLKSSAIEDKDQVSNSATVVNVRRKFPETWIWHDMKMGSVQL